MNQNTWKAMLWDPASYLAKIRKRFVLRGRRAPRSGLQSGPKSEFDAVATESRMSDDV